MNREIKNKLQRGLALTVKESWDLYKYIEALEQKVKVYENTSNNIHKKSSVEWKANTDYIEIPEGQPINITLSPEEVKDIAAMYDMYNFNELIEQIKSGDLTSYKDKGEISDGYHTFNQLYHQRAILFATIVNQNKDKAWKSFKHSDGHYCFDEDGEWFIVGVDTPQGSYTYHYAKEYWDMFNCQELEFGKEWDGHSEEDVVRLLSLEQQSCEDCISREAVLEFIADDNISLEQVVKNIHTLPPVTPKVDWISVDERMPEDGQKVLFCDIDNDIMIGYHVRGRQNTHFSQDGSYEDIKNVRAWMPMPVKPYFEDIKNTTCISLVQPYKTESEE